MVYPQPITAFAFPDPDGRPAPDRLVNQGKLYNDTRLIIYKPPVRKSDSAEGRPIAALTQSSPEFNKRDDITRDSR